MPQVPEFPIFMHVGEVSVCTHVNKKTFKFCADQIDRLRSFHALVFTKIVPVVKDFMVFNPNNSENSFLVIPVDSNYNVNWKIVIFHDDLQFIDLKNKFQSYHDYSNLECSLVETNYRKNAAYYLVTNIRYNINCLSPFPDHNYSTFADYYHRKHNLIIEDLNQPLLEVCQLKNKLDFHKPCTRMEKDSERDLLIPEFCRQIDFPTSYFIKASTLPTILYRLSHLLLAENLRVTISQETEIGRTELNQDEKWQPLTVDIKDSADTESSSLSLCSLDQEFNNGLNISVISDSSSDTDYCKNESLESVYCGFDGINERADAPPLQFHKNNSLGPEPTAIAKALTSAHADDIVNSERLETLGDAFLKFATCLYLYEEFPDLSEGSLTHIKTKLVSNRNLYYCGNAKSITGIVRVEKFREDIVPCFSVCNQVRNILQSKEICPTFLQKLKVLPEERFQGFINADHFSDIQKAIENFDIRNGNTNMEYYFSSHLVHDKMISDSVEALLGVYLQECSIENAFKVLQWFQILPKFSIPNLLTCNNIKPVSHEMENSRLNTMVAIVERRIGYKFKNSSYLLEAFTHPTYTNKVSKSYEKLEFLGDSILDFIITKYIYEKCSDLNPGQLTDLRSALVNNNIFACWAVKYGLHTILLSFSSALQNVIDKFVRYQEKRNYSADSNCFEILSEKNGCNLAEFIEAPKVLGDVFESLFGAIYLDCHKDLNIVWSIVYKLTHNEIEKFIIDTPKQPVRKILEMNVGARYSKSSPVDGTKKIKVTVHVKIQNNFVEFNGFGSNKKQARCAASYHACDYIQRLIKNAK